MFWNISRHRSEISLPYPMFPLWSHNSCHYSTYLYLYQQSNYVLHESIGAFLFRPPHVGTLKFAFDVFLRTWVNFLTNYTASLQTTRQSSFVNLISILCDNFPLIWYYIFCKFYFICCTQFVSCFVICTQSSNTNVPIAVKPQTKILRYHLLLHNCTHIAGKERQKTKSRKVLRTAFLFPNTCNFSKTNEILRSFIIWCVFFYFIP